jgi:hypothetical protein
MSDERAKHNLVIVEWVDHASYSQMTWRPLRSTSESDALDLTPFEVTSVGYIVKDEPDHIVVRPTMCPDGKGLGEMMLLRGSIRSIRKLHVGGHCNRRPKP